MIFISKRLKQEKALAPHWQFYKPRYTAGGLGGGGGKARSGTGVSRADFG